MFYYTFKILLFNKSHFVFMSDKNAADFYYVDLEYITLNYRNI